MMEKIFNLNASTILGAIVLISVGFLIGDYSGKKACNEAIDKAVLTAQTDFELQLEQANSKNQKVIIKTIKQNEVIKKSVSSYDTLQRIRLLAKIENFESRK